MKPASPALVVFLLAGLVLNEVLYDPDGPDGDREFVELLNDAAAMASLEGVELWFVNGSDPDHPRRLWTGGPDDRVAAGATFVLGEAAVVVADRFLSLDLQNGPDGLELRRQGQRLDAVAWGEGAPLLEGAPAADAAGTSIGRVPDGTDTDDNARDWRPLPVPTPGAVNLPAHDFAWIERSLEPPWSARPGQAELRFALRAIGHAPLQQGRWILDAAPAQPFSLVAGETLFVRAPVALSSGSQAHALRVEAAGGGSLDGDFVTRTGPAELVLTEVLVRPAPQGHEWVELLARARVVLAAGWTLEDAGGEAHALPDSLPLEAGERVVLASDPSTLPAGIRGLRPDGGLPTLNDSGDGAYADQLVLRDPAGVAVDLVRWSAAMLGVRGHALERASITPDTPALWFAGAGPPTPGQPNPGEQLAPPRAGLVLAPDPFLPDSPGAEGVLVAALGAAAREASAEVLDLQGAQVIALPATRGEALVRWQWDGRDGRGRPVPAGAYVFVARWTDARGRTFSARRLFGVGR